MKGWELLKEIAEEKIKEGTQFLDTYFEIIEEQEKINIQDIEELDEWITRRNGEVTVTEGKILEIVNKLNELIKSVKQLDERIKK